MKDQSITHKIKKKLDAQFKKSVLTLEDAKSYSDQLDFLGLFQSKWIPEEESEENALFEEEINVDDNHTPDFSSFRDMDNEILIKESKIMLKKFLQTIQTKGDSETIKEFADAGVAREVNQSLEFFAFNNLVLNLEELELDEDSVSIQFLEEYLLVDVELNRRKNGNKKMYLVKPFETPGHYTLKKKKLSRKPKCRRVTRICLDFGVRVKGDIKYVSTSTLQNNELVPVEVIKHIDESFTSSALFENFWMEYNLREFKRNEKMDNLKDTNARLFHNFENLKLVDFNDSLKGNFFVK